MMELRIAVTGGRYYGDREVIYRILDEVEPTTLATGACPYGGADELAEQWARSREVDYMGYPAKFKRDGKRAGPERNKRMLDQFKPDLVLAFPGGAGTAGTVALARAAGIPVRMVE